MGQKSHPYGLRLGIATDWTARWYSEKEYAANVFEDYKIRTFLTTELKRGALSRIDIERIGDKKVQVDVHTGRPGVVIGRGGSEAERMRAGLENLSGRRVKFNVIEVHNPELDATLLARSVADQLEGRVSFRRAMKRTVSTALKAGAEGVRVQATGRLGGADMGRREWYLEGRVPLHTLRADIDYGEATASTTVGAIGVKVWVYKGDVMKRHGSAAGKAAAEARLAAGGKPERSRRKSIKARAEEAAGAGRESRIIEAGGGKRVVEAGGGKRSSRLIEAGGGKKVTAAEAEAELEEAREAVSSQLTADSPAPEAADEDVAGVATPRDTEAVTEEVASPDGDDAVGEPTAAPDAQAESGEASAGADVAVSAETATAAPDAGAESGELKAESSEPAERSEDGEA